MGRGYRLPWRGWPERGGGVSADARAARGRAGVGLRGATRRREVLSAVRTQAGPDNRRIVGPF